MSVGEVRDISPTTLSGVFPSSLIYRSEYVGAMEVRFSMRPIRGFDVCVLFQRGLGRVSLLCCTFTVGLRGLVHDSCMYMSTHVPMLLIVLGIEE